MKKIILFFFVANSLFCYSQSTTVINFQEKKILTKEMLVKAPPMLRELMKNQINNTIITSKLSFKNEIVYYQSEKINKKINVNGEVAKKGNDTYSDTETKITSGQIKIRKDIVKQDYSTIENKKTVNKPIEKVKWTITKTTKKILNFNCFLATTTYKGQKLDVYFTTEIKGKASPEKLPFVDGVVLEFKTPNSTGVATKIDFNQPDIKNFFEE
jgi:GLPGLI family protein